MQHTAFFGDGDQTFALPYPMMEELQRKTGVGIGVLYQRVRAMAFGIADIAETIRLGLIGGGMEPKAADALVKAYVHARPLAETLPVAIGILEVVWFGPSENSQDDQRHADAARSGDLAAAISEAYQDVADV